MRHGEIMSIITNQTLDPILAQQVVEQIFAFVPASPIDSNKIGKEVAKGEKKKDNPFKRSW